MKFLARGRVNALFLTSTEAVLSLAKPQAQAHAETSTSSPDASGTVLAMQLAGANPESQVTGKDALPGRVNYLRGKGPAHWHTQIPTYAKVAYEGIYPGVDLLYYGNQGQLEYDFVVAPGADPGVLKLVFRGADRITGSPDFPNVNAVQPASGGFEDAFVAKLDWNGSQLLYSTYLGGSEFDLGSGIAVDDRGNAYVTGFTGSPEFPNVNAVQPALGGRNDAFVAKLGRPEDDEEDKH